MPQFEEQSVQKLRPLEGLKESGGQLFLATIKSIIQKRFI